MARDLVTGPPPTPPRFVQERIAKVLAMHWLGCLDGQVPRGVTAPLDLGEARVRRLCEHPRFRTGFNRDRTSRFWHREWAFVALRCALMLRSAHLNGTTQPASLAELARLTGLSTYTVRTAIERAATTGDLVKGRSTEDARRLVVEPAPHLVTESLRLQADFFDMAAAFMGRRSPLPHLSPDARRQVSRLLWQMALTMGGPAGEPPGRFARRTFFYLMLDLLLDGPQAPAGYIAAQAVRLQVTTATLRNVLARARADGWLEPGPPLAASGVARQRFGLAFAVLELRWGALFDALEAVVRDPDLAPHLQAPLERGAPRWPRPVAG
jgi:hypothetical protein